MNFNFLSALTFVVAIIVSYLLGSISFSIVFSRLLNHTDVREHGSGNAGMTNAMRVGGIKTGLPTFAGDFIKAVVAVSIGKFALPHIFLSAFPTSIILNQSTFLSTFGQLFAFICGVACMLGHIYPIFFGFRGGKAVVTGAALVLMLDWRCGVISLLVFAIVFLIFKMASLGSIMAAISFPISIFFFYINSQSELIWGLSTQVVITAFALIIAAIIVIKHSSNIGRIVRGEEKKVVFGKKKSS